MRKADDAPLVSAGYIVHHGAFGVGQVVALEVSFSECPSKIFEVPYLRSLPDEISFLRREKCCCMIALEKELYLSILWYSKIIRCHLFTQLRFKLEIC